MQKTRLFTLFLQALVWNAFSYGTYKICYLLMSYMLYIKLNQIDFTIWTVLISLIFLWLLIFDCGFRKSIPRFCLEFSSNNTVHRRFVRRVCIIQLSVLMLALPLWYQVVHSFFTTSLQISIDTTLFLLGLCLFFLQGCLALIRILYHAHFWNRQFNSMATCIVCIECLLTLLLCMSSYESKLLLHLVLITNCIGTACTIIISTYMMPRVSPVNNAVTTSEGLTKQFMIHSVCMWITNILKSLTERNFLVPYILYTLGPTIGITFKLTHDAALFFYRIALKTIGVNDTALLAYARHCPHESKTVFTQLIKTVIYMVIFLVVAACMLACVTYYLFSYKILIGPFFIFMVSYMIEFLLSPYERILEISLQYKLLAIAYVPYFILLLCMFYYQTITKLGLMFFISIVQGLRTMSSLIMMYNARHRT